LREFLVDDSKLSLDIFFANATEQGLPKVNSVGELNYSSPKGHYCVVKLSADSNGPLFSYSWPPQYRNPGIGVRCAKIIKE